MGILVDIFDEERHRLSEKIGDGPPEKAARIIQNFLGTLPAKYEEKNTDLTLNEKRRLGFLVDLLQETASLLVVHTAKLAPSSHPTRYTSGPQKIAQLVLFALLAGGLVAIGAFSAVLLLLLLIIATLPLKLIPHPDKWLSALLSSASTAASDPSSQAEKPEVRVNPGPMLIELRKIIQKAETLFEDEKDKPEPEPAYPIHGAKDLLHFFQSLLEAAQFKDAEFALKTVRSLKRLLLEQNIQIEDYKEGQNDSHFSFMPGGDERRQTQKPALISAEGHLLVRGIILEASKNT